MKKGKCMKMQKGIRNTQSKFNCNFTCNEHVFFDEVFIRIKYRQKQINNRDKKRWLRIFNLPFLLKYITEIIKTMF